MQKFGFEIDCIWPVLDGGNDADNVSSMQKSKAKNDADVRQSVSDSASPQRFTTTNLVNPVAATSDSGFNG